MHLLHHAPARLFANLQLDTGKVARKLALTAAADKNGRAGQYTSGRKTLSADDGGNATGCTLGLDRSRQAGKGLGSRGALGALGGLRLNGPAAAGTEDAGDFGGVMDEEEEEQGLEAGAATGFGALQLQTGRGMQQQKQQRRVGGLAAAAAAGDVGGGLGYGGVQGFALDDSQRSADGDFEQKADKMAQLLAKEALGGLDR
jgi:hypothetical protein